MRRYKDDLCAWCGNLSIDGAHVPTQFMIHKQDRPLLKGQWPVMPSCETCNQKLKLDEEWFITHFSSILYDYSEKAQIMFDGPVTNHLKHNPSIANKYFRFMSLVELEINGVKQGVKTAIILPPDEKKRLKKVAEMFARGLYYWHTKKSAKPYCSVVVYLFQERYEHLIKILENINLIRLFPNSFEYSFNITRETGEAVIFIYIYQKPAFLVELVTEERYSRMKDKTSKKGSDRKSIIEILG